MASNSSDDDGIEVCKRNTDASISSAATVSPYPAYSRACPCVRACLPACPPTAIFSGMKAGTRRIKGTSILTRERRNPYGTSQMHPTFPTFLTILNLKKKLRKRMTKMTRKNYLKRMNPPTKVRATMNQSGGKAGMNRVSCTSITMSTQDNRCGRNPMNLTSLTTTLSKRKRRKRKRK